MPRLKYRDNMTADELRAFLGEIDALNAAYAAAAAHDATVATAHPVPDEWEDESEILRCAALNRGQP